MLDLAHNEILITTNQDDYEECTKNKPLPSSGFRQARLITGLTYYYVIFY